MQTMLIAQAVVLIAAAICTAGATDAGEAADARRVTTVNRIELVIDRPAEAIWPFLLDLTKWATDQKVEYLNDHWGKPGGELRRRTFRDGRLAQDRIERIIAVEPQRRLTVSARPAPPDPSDMNIIANMELIPIGVARTTFRLDVYIASDLPEPLDLDGVQRRKQEMENRMTPALLARYQQLKAAVEKE